MGKKSEKKSKTADEKKAGGKRAEGKKAEGKKAKVKSASKVEPRKVEAPTPKRVAEVADPAGAASASEAADLLRVGDNFDLAQVDPGSTPGVAGKEQAEVELASGADELAEWQERLYAEGKDGGNRSLLLIVQGMDTSGKGGIMRHVVGAIDPQGVRITSFKAPTAQEKSKGYLWRIRQALPTPGYIGVFDRSQYEDVLIARVRNLVPRASWSRRYTGINTFERQTVATGTTIVKVMLHISSEEQRTRLAERIERPDKHWKFNPGDINERQLWPDYQQAYQDALTKCSTDEAPWFVVPADHKWYARWAVQQLLLDALRGMGPTWPPPHFDPAEQALRLAQS